MSAFEEVVPPDLMSLADVARRCGVCLMTARSWPKGIRVGRQIVRLQCKVIGTRCKIRQEDLDRFQADCHTAMFGEEPNIVETPTQFERRAAAAKARVMKMLSAEPAIVETPTQQQRRAKEEQRRAIVMCGRDPDAPPRSPRKKSK